MSAAVVYVTLASGRIEAVDPAPLPDDRFSDGHFWMFDHSLPDPDDPYTCGLCNEPRWRAYGEQCGQGRSPADLNAERAEWIASHRYDGELPWYLREGLSGALS
ncbi:hypothetical protein AB0N99_21200 [Streptomyces sp. NPDC093272]|uniref:hypothetical protein n=1 Tax=Streptomyces sp. NPDC093272 TaxID=3154981 RepID=UPI00342C7E75